jgi:Pyridoxamine 5'-phosphate oxidase
MDTSSEPGREYEFTTDMCLRLLGGQRVGRIVFGESSPLVRPVNFVVVDDEILIRMNEPLPESTRVVFEVDEFDVMDRQGWSVIAEGEARSVTISELHPDVTERLTPWAPGEKGWIIRIQITKITGRAVRAGREVRYPDSRGYL